MANISLNGTTFSANALTGSAAAWMPTGITQREQKQGVTLVAANGTRNRVERGVNKRIWDITWDKTPNATMLALRTIARLTTSFTFVNLEGASIAVQTEDEFAPDFALLAADGTIYWNVKLTIYEL